MERAVDRYQARVGEACSFKPKIGNAEQVLVHTRPGRLGETADQRAERLSTRVSSGDCNESC